MEITENSYKLFRLGNKKDLTISLEKLSPQEDYYDSIARHVKVGKRQIIMTIDILMEFAKDIENEFKPSSVKLAPDIAVSNKVEEVFEDLPTELRNTEVLTVMINGLSMDSIDITSMTFSNETNSFTIIVNGFVEFENEPSEELKKLIIGLVQKQFRG